MMYAGVPETTVRLTRLQAEARQAEEAKELQRKRNLMVLILSHLQKYGYLNSLECLQREANISLQSVTAADNVDLLSVLQEFEVYYHIKFNRKAKLVRKLSAAESHFADDISKQAAQKRPLPRISNARDGDQKKENVATAASPRISRVKCGLDQAEPQRGDSGVDIGVTGTTITAGDRKRPAQPDAPHFSTKEIDAALDECRAHLANERHLAQHVSAAEPRPKSVAGYASRPATPPGLYEDKLLKPLPAEYALNSEFRDLANIIRRDIFQANPNVRWSDIAGLADSKRLVKEAVVYPLKYPQFFTGLLSPWKGLLLYGPPGTGKTMIAKAVATECRTTFFNISASSIVSKWRGDSEKLVRVLFELARHHAPSTIFLDELDSIMSQRDGAEHEGSRRMKTELLIQLDGLAKTSEHVFLLAASNLPWELDTAMLRRLEKRILVDLPNHAARSDIFRKLLPPDAVDGFGNKIIGKLDYEDLAHLTDGYSGSDICLVCKESAMRPLRRIFKQLEVEAGSSGDNSSGAPASVRRDLITSADVQEAVRGTRPSCPASIVRKYIRWQEEFGSV